MQYKNPSATGFSLQFKGATENVSIRTPMEHHLSRFMLPEEKIDVSKFLICPMPGKLVSCAVEPGQAVQVSFEGL